MSPGGPRAWWAQPWAVLILGKELRRDPPRAVRELRARTAAASVALRQGATHLLTLEAVLRGQDRSGSSIVLDLLRELEVPMERVVSASQTRSTREEVLEGQRLAAALGVERLLVITTSYHLARARRYFEECAPGLAWVTTPESLLQSAGPRERAWMLDGLPTPTALAHEARMERLFGGMARALAPLPAAWRWTIEVQAGAWYRRVEDARAARG